MERVVTASYSRNHPVAFGAFVHLSSSSVHTCYRLAHDRGTPLWLVDPSANPAALQPGLCPETQRLPGGRRAESITGSTTTNTALSPGSQPWLHVRSAWGAAKTYPCSHPCLPHLENKSAYRGMRPKRRYLLKTTPVICVVGFKPQH